MGDSSNVSPSLTSVRTSVDEEPLSFFEYNVRRKMEDGVVKTSYSFNGYVENDDKELLSLPSMISPVVDRDECIAEFYRDLKKIPVPYTDDELVSMLTIDHGIVKCPCLLCSIRKDPSPWTKYYPPRDVVFKYEYYMAKDHVLRALNSVTLLNKMTMINTFGIISKHGLLDADYVKSMRRFVCSDPSEGYPAMDRISKSVGGAVEGILQPITDKLDKTLSSRMGEMEKLTSNLTAAIESSSSKMSDTKHNLAGLEHLADAVGKIADDGIRISCPPIDKIADNGLKHNVNLEIPMLTNGTSESSIISGVFKYLLGFCSPLKSIYDYVMDSKLDSNLRDALVLIVAAAIEGIRLKLAPTNKWYHLLILFSFGICIFSKSEYNRSFAVGYYGTTFVLTLGIKAYNWFTSCSEDTCDDQEDPEPAFEDSYSASDFNSPNLITSFFSSFISIVTGISDYLTIRNVVMALATYKALVNGLDFCVSSLFNVIADFINLLGSPFGISLFKKAYSKYPELFVITDYFNELKIKLDNKDKVLKRDLDIYKNHLITLNRLDLKIPMTSDYSTYRSMLRHLQATAKALMTSMKGLGIITTTRRQATFVVTLIGVPGTAKTNLANSIIDTFHKLDDSVEEFEEYIENRQTRVYNWEANKKFHDSCHESHTDYIVDDFGQSKKAVDPDSCGGLQFITLSNNQDTYINKSGVTEKETEFMKNKLTIVTTNMLSYDPQDFWAKDGGAIIRRLHSTNNCVFEIKPLKKYRIENIAAEPIASEPRNKVKPANAFGYAVTEELKNKTVLDPEAYTVVRRDFTTGAVLALPELTHAQFINLIYENKLRHEMKQISLAESQDTMPNDPRFNPYLKGGLYNDTPIGVELANKLAGVAFNAMEGTHVGNFDKEWIRKWGDKYYDHMFDDGKVMSEVAILTAVASVDNPAEYVQAYNELKSSLMHTVDRSMEKRFSDFDDVEAYLSYLVERHYNKVKGYYAAGGDSFIELSSVWLWGLVGDEKWAQFAQSNHNNLIKIVKEKMPPGWDTYISPGRASYAINAISPTHVLQVLKVNFYACVEVMNKLTTIAKTFGVTLYGLWDLLISSKLTFKDIAFKTVRTLNLFIIHTCNQLLDAEYALLGGVFSYRSVWIDTFIALIPSIALAVKGVEHVVAASDYDKNRKILRNPLAMKCKVSKMVRKKCSCVDCAKLRDKTNASATSDVGYTAKLTCNCGCDGVQPMGDSVSANDIECQDGMVKRCIFNVTLYDGTGELPYIGTANNFTMINSELGVTNHHFYLEICRVYRENPNMLCRFESYQGKHFFVNPIEVIGNCDETYADNDIVFWINRKGRTSFGGGLRNYMNKYISEADSEVNLARLLRMRFDRKTCTVEKSIHLMHVSKRGNATYLSDAQGGRTYVVNCYILNYPVTIGMCGSAAMCARTGKFFGIINAGAIGGKITYVTSITKEMIFEMVNKYKLDAFDTSNLSDKVVDKAPIPTGHIACEVVNDTHVMNDFNSIERTPIYGCMGELDMCPTYTSAWVDTSTGNVVNPPALARKKYDVSAPATSAILYEHAIAMFATTVSELAPAGERSFILDLYQAIEGEFDESPMSTKTSPGGRYVMEGITKKMIVKRNADQSFDFSPVHGKRFLKDCDDMFEDAMNGKIQCNYSSEFGKAEVLKRSKVADGKMRIVNGQECCKIISDKRLGACVSYFFKRIGLATGLCLNEDPKSIDAHVLALTLRIFNEIVPGDVSGWDTTFYSYKYYGVLKLIKQIFVDMTPEHYKALFVSVESQLYTVHIAHIRYIDAVLDGEVILEEGKFVNLAVYYEWLFGMISGGYWTLLFNTLGHAIDIRYYVLWIYCKKVIGINPLHYNPGIHPAIPFVQLEKLIAVVLKGDDMVISRSPCLPYVDFQSLKEAYGDHLMKLTNPAKDGEEENLLLSIYKNKKSSVEFCKRTWLWNHQYNRFLMVIAIDSLKKQLYYSDNGLAEYKQVVDDFFKELSQHGVEKFDYYEPSVSAAVWRHYHYRSPYSVYDIALASAVGGLGDSVARRIAPAFVDRDYSPSSEKEIKECMDLMRLLELREVSYRGNIPPGLKFVANNLNNKIKATAQSGPSCTPDPMECDDVVKGFSAMDEVISKENLLTTAFLNDGETRTESGTRIETLDPYRHDFTDISEFLSRPKRIFAGTWDTSMTQNQVLTSTSISTALESLPYTNKMSGFNLVRGTAEIRLQANSNPFQQGAMIMSFIPQFTERYSSVSANTLIIQKTQQLNVEYNCRDTEAVLRIPYVAPFHYWDRTQSLYDWGVVTLSVLAALQTEPSVGSLSVDYSLWIRFVDVEFAAPCVATMDKERKSASERPISSALQAAGKIAHTLGRVPSLAPYTKPAAWALDIASGAAYTLGYSKPLQNDRIQPIVAQGNRYSAVYNGPDTAMEIGLSSDNSVAVKNIASVRGPVDEMSFDFLKKVECVFNTLNISTTTTGLVATYGASPLSFYQQGVNSISSHTGTYRCYPPASHLAFLFGAWRGDIRLRFKAIKTQLVTARLSLQFNPSTTTTTGNEYQDMTAPRYIWDLSSSDEIVVELPWMIGTNYLGLSDISGSLTVSVINELKANASCADNIDILVYVSFGDNFELAIPVPTAPSNAPFYFAAMDQVDDNRMGAQVIENAKTTFAEVSIGEYFTSVKQLLTRYNKVYNGNVINTSLAINPYFFSATQMNIVTGALESPVFGGDVMSYVALMYASFRGSIRVGFQDSVSRNYDLNLIAGPSDNDMAPGSTSPYGPSTWNLPGGSNMMNAGITSVSQQAAFVKVPYYVDTNFSLVRPNISTAIYTSPADVPQVWANIYTPTVANGMVTRAASDDFRLANFVCTPLLLVTYS